MRVPVFIHLPHLDSSAQNELGWLRPLRRLSSAIAGYFARQSARRTLEALDDRMLSDIGLSRCEIPSAANRYDRAWR